MRVFRAILVIMVIIALGFGIYKVCSIPYSNPETIEIEVKDKFVKMSSNVDKYMVVDTENNTYEIGIKYAPRLDYIKIVDKLINEHNN